MNYYLIESNSELKGSIKLAPILIAFSFFLYFDPYFFQPVNSLVIFSVLMLALHSSRSIFQMKSFVFSKFTLVYFLLFSFPFLYSIFLVLVFDTGDYTKILQGLKMPIVFVFAVSFSSVLVERCPTLSTRKLYFFLILIQLLIVILSVFDQFFQEFIRSLNDPKEYEKISSYGRSRGVTWAYNSFFGLSVLLSWMILYLAIKEYQDKSRSSMFIFLGVSIVLFSLVARTTFLVFLFFIIYFMLSGLHKKIMFLRKNILPLVVFVICVFTFFVFYDLADLVLFSRSFEMLVNLVQTGTLETGSTNLLFDMYFFIPVDTFIFGDGFYTNEDGSYYMHTDSGYMRSLLFWGVIGFVPSLFAQVFLIFYVFRSRLERFIFILFILVLNIKGEVLSHHFALHFAIFVLAYQRFSIDRYRKHANNLFGHSL